MASCKEHSTASHVLGNVLYEESPTVVGFVNPRCGGVGMADLRSFRRCSLVGRLRLGVELAIDFRWLVGVKAGMGCASPGWLLHEV